MVTPLKSLLVMVKLSVASLTAIAIAADGSPSPTKLTSRIVALLPLIVKAVLESPTATRIPSMVTLSALMVAVPLVTSAALSPPEPKIVIGLLTSKVIPAKSWSTPSFKTRMSPAFAASNASSKLLNVPISVSPSAANKRIDADKSISAPPD